MAVGEVREGRLLVDRAGAAAGAPERGAPQQLGERLGEGPPLAAGAVAAAGAGGGGHDLQRGHGGLRRGGGVALELEDLRADEPLGPMETGLKKGLEIRFLRVLEASCGVGPPGLVRARGGAYAAFLCGGFEWPSPGRQWVEIGGFDEARRWQEAVDLFNQVSGAYLSRFKQVLSLFCEVSDGSAPGPAHPGRRAEELPLLAPGLGVVGAHGRGGRPGAPGGRPGGGAVAGAPPGAAAPGAARRALRRLREPRALDEGAGARPDGGAAAVAPGASDARGVGRWREAYKPALSRLRTPCGSLMGSMGPSRAPPRLEFGAALCGCMARRSRDPAVSLRLRSSFELASRDAPRLTFGLFQERFRGPRPHFEPGPWLLQHLSSRILPISFASSAMEASQEELECLGGDRVDQVAPRTLLLGAGDAFQGRY